MYEQVVKSPVARLQRSAFRLGELAEGVLKDSDRQLGVEFGQGVAQPPLQNDLVVAGTLRVWRFRRDLRPVLDGPAARFQPR